MLDEIVCRSIDSANIFMISENTIYTILCREFSQSLTQISTNNRFHFTIENISWKKYQIWIESIDFCDHSLSMIPTIDRSKMNITRYCESQGIGNWIFFINRYGVFSDDWRPRVDIPCHDNHHSTYHRNPGRMICQRFYG